MTSGQSGAALTLEAARDIVKAVETLFGTADIAGIVAGFTEDAVARFGDFPEMRGRGMEFWRMQGHRIAHWDAVFNVWEEGGKPSIAIV